MTRKLLAAQARSRARLMRALAGWARLTKATGPAGATFTVAATNRDGDPVELIATIRMLPDPTQEVTP